MEENEELENNIVVLNDENGNEVQFEFLDLVELDDEEYVVLLPVTEEGEEDEGEVVILRLEDTDEDSESESYVGVEDEEILNKLEIGDLRNKKVSILSGGQRQRVAIARALITNPELILADEPTGSLDSITTIHIMNIFEQLNKEGKTIIIVTHNLELAKKTKKCFTIKDGLIYKA